MSKPYTVKQKARREKERGPRPKEVISGLASSTGVSKGNIYFDKRR